MNKYKCFALILTIFLLIITGCNPETASEWSNKGSVLSMIGFHERALKCFDKSIELEPSNPGLYYNRGVEYNNLEIYDKAILDFTSAIDLTSEEDKYSLLNKSYAPEVDYFAARGHAYGGLGMYDESISDYNHAIELAPEEGAMYYNRGITYYFSGEYDNALSDFKKACDLKMTEGCDSYKMLSEELEKQDLTK